MEILNTINPAAAQNSKNSLPAPREDYSVNGGSGFSQTLAKTAAGSEADRQASSRSPGSVDQNQTVANEDSQETDGQDQKSGTQQPEVHVSLKKMPDWLRKLATADARSEQTDTSEKAGTAADLKAIRKASGKTAASHKADDPASEINTMPGSVTVTQTSNTGSAATDVQGLMSLLGSAAPKDVVQNLDEASAASLLPTAGMVKIEGREPGKADPVKGKAAGAMEAMPSDDTEIATSDTDKLFRFLKADGSGQPQEMLITGESDAQKARDRKSGQLAKAENIIVMDARRYLGFEQNENAGRVVAAIVGDKEFASVIKTAGSANVSDPLKPTGTVVNTLKIQMHPLDLGVITATMRLKADELSVDIQVHSGEAYRQLTLDQDTITKSLKDQGFAVDSVNIQLIASDRTDSNMSDLPQDRSQQQARNNGAGSFGQQAGEQSGNSKRDQTYVTAPTVETNTPGSASDGVSAGTRPGQVYL